MRRVSQVEPSLDVPNSRSMRLSDHCVKSLGFEKFLHSMFEAGASTHIKCH